MEKDRILVAHHKAVLIILFVVLLSACSLPRIIVLKDPLTPEEHINLGVAYENRGELDAALTEYETASKELPVATLYMANVYFQKKEFGKAEGLYEKAIARTHDPRAYNNLAWLYYATGKDPARAEELARKAVDLSPDSPDFNDTLARIRQTRKEAPAPRLP
jgi:tetratricopeptide (TPR) repeat protein